MKRYFQKLVSKPMILRSHYFQKTIEVPLHGIEDLNDIAADMENKQRLETGGLFNKLCIEKT